MLTPEHRRILRAVNAGRLVVNGHGRYEIVGDERRPGRRERESLIRRGLMLHPAPNSNVCRSTEKGRAEQAGWGW